MAERRMFAKTIIDSDEFLDMPATTQLLYFHLSMRADDDGFVNNPKKILRMVGCSDDDLKLLLAKSFVFAFDSGVVVIKHWKIHNYIRKDTYSETRYKIEKSQLCLDENKEYQFCVDEPSTDGGRAVDEPSTQVRLVKDRLGEVRIGQDSLGEDRSSTTTEQEQDLSTGEKVKALVKKYWKRDLVYDDALHYLSKVLTDGSEDSNKMQMLEIALKLSAAHGEKACNWAYVNAIYDGWRERNITTPEEWAAYEQSRKDGAR